MTHGSLFSGIGGFDLAAGWAGWMNLFHCDNNPFGQRVLKYYWPDAKSYEDIKTTDFTIWRGRVDVLSGGFPCQPFSAAGKRKGTEDDRHLWPEMLRAIREIAPRYVVGENVYGLVNWDGGVVFNQVQADLEAEGYEVQPVILPACSVGAPHRRDRVWFVAYSDKCAKRSPGKSGGIIGGRRNNNDEQKERREQTEQYNGFNHVLQTFTDSGLLGPEKCEKQTAGIKQCDKGNDSNPDCDGCNQRNGNDEKHTGKGGVNAFCNAEQGDVNGDAPDTNGGRQPGEKHGEAESKRIAKNGIPNYWQNFPTQPPVCGGDDGLPAELDGITFPKWRNETIKAFGNAIVPQVAYQIFSVINQHENNLKKTCI